MKLANFESKSCRSPARHLDPNLVRRSAAALGGKFQIYAKRKDYGAFLLIGGIQSSQDVSSRNRCRTSRHEGRARAGELRRRGYEDGEYDTGGYIERSRILGAECRLDSAGLDRHSTELGASHGPTTDARHRQYVYIAIHLHFDNTHSTIADSVRCWILS